MGMLSERHQHHHHQGSSSRADYKKPPGREIRRRGKHKQQQRIHQLQLEVMTLQTQCGLLQNNVVDLTQRNSILNELVNILGGSANDDVDFATSDHASPVLDMPLDTLQAWYAEGVESSSESEVEAPILTDVE
eukprot:2370052-Karenia_brevis.AAC.1